MRNGLICYEIYVCYAAHEFMFNTSEIMFKIFLWEKNFLNFQFQKLFLTIQDRGIAPFSHCGPPYQIFKIKVAHFLLYEKHYSNEGKQASTLKWGIEYNNEFLDSVLGYFWHFLFPRIHWVLCLVIIHMLFLGHYGSVHFVLFILIRDCDF